MRLSRLAILGFACAQLGCGAARPPEPLAAPARPAAKPTCLVLSVGGPAGFAHLGAIEELRKSGVQVSCVVGNSMGALVGSLYAADPAGDTTAHAQALIARYVQATKDEAAGRGVGVGLLGLLLFGPIGAIAGGTLGATTVDQIQHERLVGVLDDYLGKRSIEQLALPFRTSYVQQAGDKVAFYEAKSGNVAAAVGASIANPLIFSALDVRSGGPIDPGLDRVAAVPIEQACASFPDHLMVAVNVTREPPFVSARMNCPTYEIAVDVHSTSPNAALSSPEAFASTVSAGREAMAGWLRSPAAEPFLNQAERISPEGAFASAR
jgi:predicted acylesterase/phospholipase RssA